MLVEENPSFQEYRSRLSPLDGLHSPRQPVDYSFRLFNLTIMEGSVNKTIGTLRFVEYSQEEDSLEEAWEKANVSQVPTFPGPKLISSVCKEFQVLNLQKNIVSDSNNCTKNIEYEKDLSTEELIKVYLKKKAQKNKVKDKYEIPDEGFVNKMTIPKNVIATFNVKNDFNGISGKKITNLQVIVTI